ncbi:hypothetical protein Tco_0530315 [Tanacetum coccineum]
MVRLGTRSHDPARAGGIYPGSVPTSLAVVVSQKYDYNVRSNVSNTRLVRTRDVLVSGSLPNKGTSNEVLGSRKDRDGDTSFQ